MGIVELKRAVDELPTEERLELAAYIRHTFRADDQSWQEEIARRLNDCLGGKGHDAEELLALHDRLRAGGQ
jgi:hypothetical protein